MKYPRFLKENDTIGITAISSGTGDKIKEVKTSLNHLKKDYKLIITPNVYGEEIVSSSVKVRVNEFNGLLNEDIKALLNIRGGDFSYEVLDGLNYKKIIDKRLLIQGASDTTSLVYILTTKYDYATLYGFNAKGYDSEVLEKDQLNNFEFLKGNLLTQHSYHDRIDYSVNGDFNSKGVIIGGCLDIMRFLFGTSYDGTKKFINKYKDKKIIWYFDIFAMGSVDVYLTLLQMKKMGYFKYSDTFIFGSILFPRIECEMEYADAYKKAIGEKNIIVDANIGHVNPRFTILNGSYATVNYQNNELVLKQELMNEDNS